MNEHKLAKYAKTNKYSSEGKKMTGSISMPKDRGEKQNNGFQFLQNTLKSPDSSDIINNLSSNIVNNDQKMNSPGTNNMIHSSGKKLVTCQYCGKILSKKYINRHVRRHTDPESLTTICDICGDTVRKDYLSTHRLIHTDPESLYTICDICCDTVRKEYIEKHSLIHTDPESLTTICNICGDTMTKENISRQSLQQNNPKKKNTNSDI